MLYRNIVIHYSLFRIHYSNIALKVNFNWLEEKQLLFLAHESSCHYLWSVLGHIKTWNFHIKAIFVSDIFICILSFSATIYTNGDTHWKRVESVWCFLFYMKRPSHVLNYVTGDSSDDIYIHVPIVLQNRHVQSFLQLFKHIFEYQSNLLATFDFRFRLIRTQP